MLQAPTSDRKTKSEASSKTAEYLPEYEQSSQSIGGIGRSRQSQPLQQRENLANLQKVYGNQAVLRMKGRSPAANPMQGGVLQRKCACGNSAASSGSCAECQSKQEGILQTKLQIGEVGDRYEQEADLVADRVMRMLEQNIQHQVEPEAIANAITPLQRRSTDQEQISEVPPIVNEVLHSQGQPLEPETRTFMESRFGHDFGHVRVHTDLKAAASAKAVNALAYTVGPTIVFAAGKYAPFVPEGRRLLAHELAHTIQQSSVSFGVQRGGVAGSILQRVPSCARPTSCPAEFCGDFINKEDAKSDLAANRDRLLSLVGQPVLDGGAEEVRALYGDFLDGGHALRDLSSRLARFFARSSTTGRSIRFLDRSLEEYFRSNPPPPGGSITVKIQDAIPRAVAALGTPGDPNVMAFRDYTETPGLLAGGVGEGQATCPVGAKPSTVEDSRTATGTATGTNSNGTILVSSSIEFSVTDTLDFCPGHCGSSNAQELTVPLSRYEATGISGDEPFTVTFSAPIGAFDSE